VNDDRRIDWHFTTGVSFKVQYSLHQTLIYVRQWLAALAQLSQISGGSDFFQRAGG
jgi:hypothetical protein